jgi:hypothetical protein
MQPTENKQPAQEELIAHIRKNLKAHEEPYSLGAWENFEAKQQTKKTPIFWITRLSGVAAVIAICFSLFLLTKSDTAKQGDEVVKKVNPNQTVVEDNETMSQNETDVVAQSTPVEIVVDKNNLPAQPTNLVAAIEFVVENTQPIDKTVEVVENKTVVERITDQKIAAIVEEKAKVNTGEFLAQESQKNESIPDRILNKRAKSKWVLGLMIAPSLGNAEELNMGYGVSMGYNISDKLSLITGVSYNEMSASKDFNSNIGTASILYGNNKSLAGISQRITGVDIPLELKYSFNKSVYASLGVSAFAVIGQSRNNIFIQGVVVSGTNKGNSSAGSASASAPNVADASSSKGQFANTYIQNQKIVESASLGEQNDVNYLGFYNFSVGYKKMVLKRHYVAFEPFVKLPIREVTQDNLRLVGAGLRLKVDF